MSLTTKFMLAIGVVFFVVMGFTIPSVYISQHTDVADDAERESELHIMQAERLLEVTDILTTQQVQSSIKLLREYSNAHGQPQLSGRAVVKDRQTRDMRIGDQDIANNFEIVDHLTSIMGGTATIFVRDDNQEYVRISTNVQTKDGRAIGTILAPQGAAIQKIRNNQAYYGIVDILGSPYITAYEPMPTDTKSLPIGIWYVGYKADLQYLKTIIEKSRILKSGFVFIRDKKGAIHANSDNIDPERANQIVNSADKDWIIKRVEYEPWNYEIIAVYSKDDITSTALGLSVTTGIFIFVCGLVILGVVYGLLRWMVSRPLQITTDRVLNIVEGEGDLTLRLDMQQKDEFGMLAGAFDSLLDKLQHTIKSLTSFAKELNGSSDVLNDIAVQTNNSLEDQKRELEMVASAITQLAASVREIKYTVSEVSSTAESADNHARQGDKELRASVNASGSLANDIESTANVVQELADSSNEVGSVLDVIRSIAEQTNLLALNAAIEAARAGEQGRGFAVVADEVRSLAGRTQDSTEQVDTMLKQFRLKAESAIDRMRQANDAGQKNATALQSSGEMISQVLQAVTQLNNLSAQILVGIGQQNTATEEIQSNSTRITDNANDCLQRTAQTLKSAKALSALANKMSEELASYRV